MSIRNNTWNLDGHYDLTKSGQNTYSDPSEIAVGPLYVFGYNNAGQLGLNEQGISRSSPTQIPGTQWYKIGGARYNYLAVKDDNTLWAWGQASYGQLGQNSRTYYSSPVQIPGTQWSDVSYTYRNSVATKTDGTLYSFGSNINGQLGVNDVEYKSSPVQVPGTQWEYARGTYYLTYFKKTDGTAWAAGTQAGNGLFGINLTQSYASSPVQIPGTQWNNVRSGSYAAFFTKTDNTLWSWGRNSEGQLGHSDTERRSSPTQIPGTQWSVADGGLYYTVGLKTDGTLWAWGYNANGQLGLNEQGISRSSPTQIPGTEWSQIGVGQKHSLATKTDGTLWAWGHNHQGQLAQSTLSSGDHYSSPVQIPGTQWNSLKLRPAYSSTAIILPN